jgi:hypothetical protein
VPLQSSYAPNNGPAKPLEENNFARTEVATHRTSEAESDSIDRCTANVTDGTAEQGELERLAASVRSVQREEAAARLPKAARLASVLGPAPVGDGIWPPHPLEPDYLAQRDALRGPQDGFLDRGHPVGADGVLLLDGRLGYNPRGAAA